MTRRLSVRTVFVVATIVICACAPTSGTHWDRSLKTPAAPAAGPVVVMEPIVEGTAAPGNVGRNLTAVRKEVQLRILASVRERATTIDIPDTPPHLRFAALASYPAALADGIVSSEELDAANVAFERGATYLITPTILEWTEMRTDDPIGALVTSHNRIAIDLRLMQLEPPVQVAHVVFRNGRASRSINRRLGCSTTAFDTSCWSSSRA